LSRCRSRDLRSPDGLRWAYGLASTATCGQKATSDARPVVCRRATGQTPDADRPDHALARLNHRSDRRHLAGLSESDFTHADGPSPYTARRPGRRDRFHALGARRLSGPVTALGEAARSAVGAYDGAGASASSVTRRSGGRGEIEWLAASPRVVGQAGWRARSRLVPRRPWAGILSAPAGAGPSVDDRCTGPAPRDRPRDQPKAGAPARPADREALPCDPVDDRCARLEAAWRSWPRRGAAKPRRGTSPDSRFVDRRDGETRVVAWRAEASDGVFGGPAGSADGSMLLRSEGRKGWFRSSAGRGQMGMTGIVRDGRGESARPRRDPSLARRWQRCRPLTAAGSVHRRSP